MSSSSVVTLHRRPALIPQDVHLSAEDQQSIPLRIGSLSLASFDEQLSHGTRDSDSTQPILKEDKHSITLCRQHLPQSSTKVRGTKRKATTTADQYQEPYALAKRSGQSWRQEGNTMAAPGSQYHALERISQIRNHQPNVAEHQYPVRDAETTSPEEKIEVVWQ